MSTPAAGSTDHDAPREPAAGGLAHANCRVTERQDLDRAFLAAYEELRRLAHALFAHERRDHTMQATVLVHEAFLRLQQGGDDVAADPAHFRRVAAVAMRRILIEHARGKHRLKHGGDRAPVSLDSLELACSGHFDRVLEVDEAIERLAQESPDLAEAVRLRFYAGLDVEAIAQTLGRSERSLRRDWSYAKTRLFQLLRDRT